MHKTWRHATRGTHLVPIVLTWYEIPVHTEFSFSKSISTAALTTYLLRTEMRAGSTTEKAPVDDVHISHLKGHFYWSGFRKSHATQKSCQANLVFLLLACVWKHGKQGFWQPGQQPGPHAGRISPVHLMYLVLPKTSLNAILNNIFKSINA